MKFTSVIMSVIHRSVKLFASIFVVLSFSSAIIQVNSEETTPTSGIWDALKGWLGDDDSAEATTKKSAWDSGDKSAAWEAFQKLLSGGSSTSIELGGSADSSAAGQEFQEWQKSRPPTPQGASEDPSAAWEEFQKWLKSRSPTSGAQGGSAGDKSAAWQEFQKWLNGGSPTSVAQGGSGDTSAVWQEFQIWQKSRPPTPQGDSADPSAAWQEFQKWLRSRHPAGESGSTPAVWQEFQEWLNSRPTSQESLADPSAAWQEFLKWLNGRPASPLIPDTSAAWPEFQKWLNSHPTSSRIKANDAGDSEKRPAVWQEFQEWLNSRPPTSQESLADPSAAWQEFLKWLNGRPASPLIPDTSAAWPEFQKWLNSHPTSSRIKADDAGDSGNRPAVWQEFQEWLNSRPSASQESLADPSAAWQEFLKWLNGRPASPLIPDTSAARPEFQKWLDSHPTASKIKVDDAGDSGNTPAVWQEFQKWLDSRPPTSQESLADPSAAWQEFLKWLNGRPASSLIPDTSAAWPEFQKWLKSHPTNPYAGYSNSKTVAWQTLDEGVDTQVDPSDSGNPFARLHNGNSPGSLANCSRANELKPDRRGAQSRRISHDDEVCEGTRYPFIVQLDFDIVKSTGGEAKYSGTGSVVSSRWILSSLHLFLGVPSHPIPGWVSCECKGSHIIIVEVVRHYRNSFVEAVINDVVLVKTERAIQNHQPLRLPTSNNRVTDSCKSMTAVKLHSLNAAKKLEYVCFKYAVADSAVCLSQPNIANRSESIICATALSTTVNYHQAAEYGSPLICHSDFDIVIGIMSESKFDRNKDTHVFTRIDYYLEFIRSVAGYPSKYAGNLKNRVKNKSAGIISVQLLLIVHCCIMSMLF